MGKSHLLIALFIASIIFQANAVNLDGSYPLDPEAEKDALKIAETLDPMGNAKPTKDLPAQTFEGKKYKAIRLETRKQISALLTPEQQSLFEQYTQELDTKREAKEREAREKAFATPTPLGK